MPDEISKALAPACACACAERLQRLLSDAALPFPMDYLSTKFFQQQNHGRILQAAQSYLTILYVMQPSLMRFMKQKT